LVSSPRRTTNGRRTLCLDRPPSLTSFWAERKGRCATGGAYCAACGRSAMPGRKWRRRCKRILLRCAQVFALSLARILSELRRRPLSGEGEESENGACRRLANAQAGRGRAGGHQFRWKTPPPVLHACGPCKNKRSRPLFRRKQAGGSGTGTGKRRRRGQGCASDFSQQASAEGAAWKRGFLRTSSSSSRRRGRTQSPKQMETSRIYPEPAHPAGVRARPRLRPRVCVGGHFGAGSLNEHGVGPPRARDKWPITIVFGAFGFSHLLKDPLAKDPFG